MPAAGGSNFPQSKADPAEPALPGAGQGLFGVTFSAHRLQGMEELWPELLSTVEG